MVYTALVESQALLTGTPDIFIQKKPTTGVFAKAAYSENDLVFVPISLNITAEADSTKTLAPKQVAITVDDADVRFLVSRYENKDFVAPFWSMRKVDDQSDANMVIIGRSLSCFVPHTNPKGESRQSSGECPCRNQYEADCGWR